MGPDRDRTHDPWICSRIRICSQTRYRLRYAARRKAQEIISLTPFPDVRTKPAESGLPHQATSASYLSRPDGFASATVPPLEPKIPVLVEGNFARNFTVPERGRLLFEDRSNPHVSKPAPTVSFDLGEPAVSDVSGIAPIPDMRAIERQRRHTMDVMKALPKGLIFDGKSNWFAFKHKMFIVCVSAGLDAQRLFQLSMLESYGEGG